MKNLIKLLIDNREAAAGVRFESVNGEANVYLKGVIADEYGASASALRASFAEAAGADVSLHINSPGGDVFEAREMQAVIAGYSGKVNAVIEGVAASAATIVSMAANQVLMLKGSRYMIHNGWSLAMGDKNAMLSMAQVLASFDAELAAEYGRKTGASADQAATWMNAETWFNADQALEAKFVDGLIDNTKNLTPATVWNLSAYTNAPKDTAPPPDFAAIRAANQRRLQLLQFA